MRKISQQGTLLVCPKFLGTPGAGCSKDRRVDEGLDIELSIDLYE